MSRGRPRVGPASLVVPLHRRLLLLPLAAGLLLCAVSATWQLAKGAGWQPVSLQLDRVLNVDEDLSVINWLSASTFLLAALLAAVVAARTPDRRRVWWWVLVLGVVFVSVDESVGVSDPVRVAVETALRAGGLPLVVVAVAATAALVVSVAILRALPAGVRWRAVLAVVLVAVAAVGIDSLGPDLVDRPEDRLQTWYVLKTTLEEAVEIVAAVLLLDAMVLTARQQRPGRGRSGGEDARREPLQQHQA